MKENIYKFYVETGKDKTESFIELIKIIFNEKKEGYNE